MTMLLILAHELDIDKCWKLSMIKANVVVQVEQETLFSILQKQS
jgi:hypothetical protein